MSFLQGPFYEINLVFSCVLFTGSILLWSIVLLRSLLEKTYTSTEWLSLLADSIDSPQQVDNYAFKVSMDDDDYMLIVLPQ